MEEDMKKRLMKFNLACITSGDKMSNSFADSWLEFKTYFKLVTGNFLSKVTKDIDCPNYCENIDYCGELSGEGKEKHPSCGR